MRDSEAGLEDLGARTGECMDDNFAVVVDETHDFVARDGAATLGDLEIGAVLVVAQFVGLFGVDLRFLIVGHSFGQSLGRGLAVEFKQL